MRLPTPITYQSNLDQWYERENVRNKPRHVLNDELLQNKLCFSPEPRSGQSA